MLILAALVVSCSALDADGNGQARVGWVWDVGNRSSFDVLWSCLAVILVCTYKVVHLNLPAESEAEASWRRWGFWKKWLRKLKWMGFMALSPEMLLSMALQDWLWSRDSVRKFRESSLKNKSYTADSGKAMADVVESVPTIEKMSIARSMPNCEWRLLSIRCIVFQALVDVGRRIFDRNSVHCQGGHHGSK